jgi:hypothetical protein
LIVRRIDMPTHAGPSGDPEIGSAPEENDLTKPSAMAIQEEGFFKKEEGRYGPIFP